MSKVLYGLAQAATSIGLSCDATTVQQYHFMGGVIGFLFKEVLEVDMFGSTQCSTNKIDFALNPMLLGAKYSTVVMRSDGSEFLAESPLAMTRALFYSGGMPMMAEFGGKMGVCLDGAWGQPRYRTQQGFYVRQEFSHGVHAGEAEYVESGGG